ncbi:MAG: ribosome small subunit-dependent GTPase A [Shimia thalassica]|uniref:ribosome small subunit-dependent GTPase A n=2 Tax=Shimia thalassica TaxID=1715693 RepID=UPI003296CC6C
MQTNHEAPVIFDLTAGLFATSIHTKPYKSESPFRTTYESIPTMTRDYSSFLPTSTKGEATEIQKSKIDTLGWQPFFARQISIDELTQNPPVRIIEVHRSGLHAVGNDLDLTLPPDQDVTVGDWVLFDPDTQKHSRVLERKSLVKRKAPGSDRQVQLIAANIDTAFIVTSCNQDFNVARLERYIALALDSDITPVIVLTKTDLAPSHAEFVEQARAISDHATVVALDARGEEPAQKLARWCGAGKTVAFLGSSGVGKSTLTNALAGNTSIETQSIREDDAKGRHTTTRRQLHLVRGGCLVLDTPGMRELQLADATAGIESVFADLQELSTQCKFNDCQHQSEPGCAVLKALEKGEISQDRLERWRKLLAEDAYNSASLAERRSKDKAFGKTIRQVLKQKKKRRL